MSETLLDTNVLVDFLRKDATAARYINGLESKPAVSVVTIMELVSGAKSKREEQKIALFGRMLPVLPVTLEIAHRAGQYVKHYKPSHGLDDLDAIIAATAEHYELKLATLNVKHFPMFPKLKPAY